MNRQDGHDLSDIRSRTEKKKCFLTARSTYIYVTSDVHIPLTVMPAVADFMTAVPIAFKFSVSPLILEMTSHNSSAVSTCG